MKNSKNDQKMIESNLRRRDFLRRALFGAGALGLRSLATGLPVGLLANPTGAKANEVEPTGRILILAAEQAASPLNANVPGTYNVPDVDVYHAPFEGMMETPLTLGGAPFTAAKPWADLPQSILDQSVFYHHRTFAGIHPDFHNVMALMGETKQGEMAASIFAENLAPKLGTVQTAPICLGKESFSYKGRFQPLVKPTSLKSAFAVVDDALGSLTELRDAEIDKIHTIIKGYGTSEQAELLDKFALTTEQVRSLSADITGGFAEITGNDQANQIKAAALVAALNLTPVITLNINFGGDNHKDADLQNEFDQHVTGTAGIAALFAELDALRASGTLQRDVLVAWTSVFGRTLQYGPDGRDHNANHCVTWMAGDSINPGVIGDARAGDLDSVTGQTITTGGADIPVSDSLCSMAKTMGAALGVDQSHLDEWIQRGKVVASAIV